MPTILPYRLCFLLLLLGGHVGISFAQSSLFTISTEQGLSNNSITDITQDSIGFIWIATKQGLNRYDATSFKVFDSDNSPLTSDDISDVLLDDKGKIWVSTVGGELAVYDAKKDSLQLVAVANCAFGKGITVLSQKDENHIWLGTEEGLFLLDTQNKHCAEYAFIPKNENTLRPEITDILTLPLGNVLVSTFGHGLWELGVETGQLQKIEPTDAFVPEYLLTLHSASPKTNEIFIGTQGNGLLTYDSEKNQTIPIFTATEYQNTIVRTLHFDKSENLWMGTDGNGLLQLLPTKKVKATPLPSSSITSIFQDMQGNIWLGTARDGLIVLESKRELASWLQALNHAPVLSIYKKDQYYFFGMDGDGLNVWDSSTNEWWNDRPNGANYIQFIQQNRRGNLWLGTFSSGLLEYHPKQGTIRQFQHIINNDKSLSFNDVRDVVEMPNGDLWIATWGGGLNFYDHQKDQFTVVKNETLNSKNIVDLAYSGTGLWLATFGSGLIFMDLNTRQFTPYPLQKSKNNQPPSEDKNLLCLHWDNQKTLWIGTWKNGLYRIDTQTGSTQWLNQEEIKKQTITAISEDDRGDLWLSTKEGILCYAKEKKTIEFFPDYAGEYHINSNYKDDDGQLYFGGKSGVVRMLPDQIKNSQATVPSVVLTEIRIFDQKRKAANQGILRKNISSTQQIHLKYSQNTLSIHFATLDFPNAQNWEYAIQLTGLEKHWREIGSQHNTTFTNLPWGEYEFKVKNRYRGGSWNDDYAILSIHIDKPFWATNWAYATYLLLIALALFLFRKYTIAWENMKHQLQMEALLHQKDKELHEAKQRFFNNISHEIRTPLTLMFAAMNQLKKAGVSDPRQLNPLKTLQNNARHLLNLVDELLSFRKMESGEIKLKMEEVDLAAYAHEILLAFAHVSEKKNIRTAFQSEDENILVRMDATQMEKVVYNLLSNAFKYTPVAGAITLTIKKDDEYAYLIVQDTGVGIPKEKQQIIFQRFYQQEQTAEIPAEGFGIGLSIVQDIVRLHEGDVWVESEVGKGSTFIVKLPLLVSNVAQEKTVVSNKNKATKKEVEPTEKREDFTILLVEDNEEIRAYLKEILAPQYDILEAADGAEGSKIACNHLPDLIISDILMPLKNGIELVKEVKADMRSSHIPIILLTSRVGWVFKKEGFDIGADDYVTKPFNEEILKARIRNLILSRQKIWKQIGTTVLTQPKELAISDPDRLFLEQFMAIVEDNIEQADLSPSLFAQKMGMSHSIIYKKLKQLTGRSIVEFIRDFRLKRAADMLKNKQGSIKEICYSCGFSDRRYFTRVFKEKYGVVPSGYDKSIR